MLALLVAQGHLTRQRRWNQDKLRSSSEPEKGGNSLQQVLFQMREALGEDAGVLEAVLTVLRLDVRRVRVVETDEGEFLEGSVFGDPKFESWLSAERVRRAREHRQEASASPLAAPSWNRRPQKRA